MQVMIIFLTFNFFFGFFWIIICDLFNFFSLHRIVNNAAPAFPSNFKKALEEFDVNEVLSL